MSKLSVWSPRPNALPMEKLSASVSIYGLPMLSISPIPLTDTQIDTILSADALFYVSQYAVTSLYSQISSDQLTNKLSDKIHIAIGNKTADTLSAIGISPTIVAKPPFNSENLLTDSDFQSLDFNHLALISGQTGRKLLEKTLKKQGKKISRIVTYQRDKCDVTSQVMIKFIHTNAINSVILTSCAIVDAVTNQLKQGVAPDFWHFPAFALSQRIADYAEKTGFTQVIVVNSANQRALYDKIREWHNNQKEFNQCLED